MKVLVFIILTFNIHLIYGQASVKFVNEGVCSFGITYHDKEVKPLADTLGKYIFLASGIQLPVTKDAKGESQIVLSTLHKNLKPIENGCYNIKIEDGRVLINADNLDYLEYGIYDLLESNFGVDYLYPGVVHFGISGVKEITISESEHCSTFGTRTVHSSIFYDHPSFAKKQKVSDVSFPHYVPGYGVHTFHRFLPSDMFFKEHPEFYAFRNGRRLVTQLCLSNAKVLEIVIDSVKAQFKKHPDAKVISVSQDDNTQYCTCDACAKLDEMEGGPTGSMIHFVNKVAEAFPDKTISTLAYQYTRKAPAKIIPRSNVLITLCSIECDRSAPIKMKCKDFEDDLKSWEAIGAQLRIWDYTTQFTNFLSPFPNLYTLDANVHTFKENGAKWTFEQHSRNPSELFELRSYITAKLLWNPSLKVEGLILNFCEKYYGDAAPYILDYIHKIHERLADNPSFFLFLYGDPSQAFDSYLKPEYLLEYMELWQKAEASIRDNPALLSRVRFASLSTKFAYLERCKKNDDPPFKMAVQSASSNSRPSFQEVLQDFESICKENDVIYLNEMGYTIAEYIEANKAIAKRAMKANLAKGKSVVTLTQPKKYANEDPMSLTDGALGGTNFYANWLGYEGNDMEVIVDLEVPVDAQHAEVAFLKVVNHIVFYPDEVQFLGSADGVHYEFLGKAINKEPLSSEVKKNDIQLFEINFPKKNIRYLKVIGKSMRKAPEWHHGAGLTSWIFADEIIVN